MKKYVKKQLDPTDIKPQHDYLRSHRNISNKKMLQLPSLLPLVTFIFWSSWTFNGVVSDPQTNLLHIGCSPYSEDLSSNFPMLINITFERFREQIATQNKYFVTSLGGNGDNPEFIIFQCRNYLSIPDCVACFDVASVQFQNCYNGAHNGRVVYDGCFLRYETSFSDQTTASFNAVSCWENHEPKGEASTFTSSVQQLLMNLQTTTPERSGFFAAMKTKVPNNGPTIYAFAQCIQTISQSGCSNCLNAASSNMPNCLPNSDGRAYADSCFMRYSTTSFFPDNQTIVITPFKSQESSSKKGYIIGGVVGGVAFLLILFVLFASWIRRPKSPKKVPSEGITGSSMLDGLVTYSYNDLRFATKNFSEENKLGEGGFGVVYKGTLKNGKVVAIKKLNFRQFTRMEKDFESEVKLISNVHHLNLVQLLGCCSEGHNRILVYEYMKNNSLDKSLFGKKKGYLNWKQRCNIILGTAKGLVYLHEEFPVRIIHRDIKTNNILLDDNLQPRIADFGLARLLPEDKSHLSTKFAGTLGYTAPEYVLHGQLSEKVDIYSYGIVVLEIISGRRSKELSIDGEANWEFLLQKAWKLYEKGMHLELVDNTLDPNDYDSEEVKKIIEIGLLCTQAYAESRPMMSEVVVLLQNKDLLENMKPNMPILIETN